MLHDISKQSLTADNMMTTQRYMIVIAALLVMTASGGFMGCEDTITDPKQIVFPPSEVSYGRHVQPVFDLSCAFSGCHNEIDQAGGLSLKSYVDLFRRPGLVRPGDSTGSILYQVVSERLPHFDVRISDLLTPNHQHGIAVWIQEGASNN